MTKDTLTEATLTERKIDLTNRAITSVQRYNLLWFAKETGYDDDSGSLLRIELTDDEVIEILEFLRKRGDRLEALFESL